MRTYDISPLFRSTVGFDNLLNMLEQSRAETTWPPYNIEKTGDDRYRITMAVAGYAASQLEITQNNTELLVTGAKKEAGDERVYLHRGIAGRPFRQTFDLAEHVKVAGADLTNGLLTIDLVREVPEALKPRSIAIGGGAKEIVNDNSEASAAAKAA